MSGQIFIKTPLIESTPLSACVNDDDATDRTRVFLKLECAQPSGSFKCRGVSEIVKSAAADGVREVVIATSGNGGLAMVYAARKLSLKAYAVVAKVIDERIRKRLQMEGATVEVCGEDWNEANQRAIEYAAESPDRRFVDVMNNPLLWAGHSTMIDEVADEFEQQGIPQPALVVSCCGAGSLLCGIVHGLRRVGWPDTHVLAMETHGADSFNVAVRYGGYPVKLPKITSIAHCLASTIICDQLGREFRRGEPPIISRVVDDRDAVEACYRFAEDHQLLVETACGAVLAGVYTGLAKQLIKDLKLSGPLLVIVCGGSSMTPELMFQLKKEFQL